MKREPISVAGAHPVSTFALDVYWTSGCKGDEALARHVAECRRCREYLALLGEMESLPIPGPRHVSSPLPARRVAIPVGGALAGALALAAGVAIVAVAAVKDHAPPSYVGIKGTPSVQLLVRRGGATAIWDGRSPVRAGDAIALRAACSDLPNVAVTTEDPARGWVRLSDAPCPKGEDVLPFTLVVDGASREERIAVVMSAARLSDEALSRAARDTERSERAWTVRFVLPEERQ
jgi:hypothetical protein